MLKTYSTDKVFCKEFHLSSVFTPTPSSLIFLAIPVWLIIIVYKTWIIRNSLWWTPGIIHWLIRKYMHGHPSEPMRTWIHIQFSQKIYSWKWQRLVVEFLACSVRSSDIRWPDAVLGWKWHRIYESRCYFITIMSNTGNLLLLVPIAIQTRKRIIMQLHKYSSSTQMQQSCRSEEHGTIVITQQ